MPNLVDLDDLTASDLVDILIENFTESNGIEFVGCTELTLIKTFIEEELLKRKNPTNPMYEK
jgi:hypothetical protein